MTDTPPWARGSSATGFTPPTPTEHVFPSELRVTTSARPVEAVAQRKSRLVTVLLSLLVVALIVAAGVLVWKAFAPQQDVSAPLPASQYSQPATGVAVGPTGTTPVATQDGGGPMTVAKMAPSTLFIPSLGIYMPVEADSTFVASKYAGFDQIRIPSNPKHGVWYKAGAPMFSGSEGTTLIAAHVSNHNGWGALRYLYKIRAGAMLYTKDAAGQLQSWQMTRMRVEDHTAFPQEYWSAKGVRQLVVTTCGGQVDSQNLFTQNLFAIASPIDPKPTQVTA